ncbi:hypothetical protein ACFS5N_06560 [Mucilaginibacter ximonensis]|uniref:Uncharacterized protein n=1 Tax=Mucilaginibacter ximonensis TaxID=538021 RepID=A0ABW5YAW1_9SPHI
MQSKSTLKYLIGGALATGFLVNSSYTTKTDRGAFQIDVGHLLNARPVTTLSSGMLVHWTKGVDRENGYLTASAAKFNGEVGSKALPDDPLIPGNSHHPAILLHYSNEDAMGYQARLLDTGTTTIDVLTGRYKNMYLCFTSAYGKSELKVELIYNDSAEVKNFTVPDWANDIPDNDPDLSYVVHDLPKWSNKGSRTEPDHHNIDALNIHPTLKHVLKQIRIKNLSKTYLMFWAAAGY